MCSQAGLMLIVGGCTEESSTKRTAEVQTMWLGPPPLFQSSLKVIKKSVVSSVRE